MNKLVLFIMIPLVAFLLYLPSNHVSPVEGSVIDNSTQNTTPFSLAGDDAVAAQVGSAGTCEPDPDTGCVTVTKELTDPQNLVPDSEERTLEFRIAIFIADVERASFRLTSGESQGRDLSAGEVYTVRELSITEGITVETTAVGDCEQVRIEVGDDLQCTIRNRITAVTGGIFVNPQADRQTTPPGRGTAQVGSVLAQASEMDQCQAFGYCGLWDVITNRQSRGILNVTNVEGSGELVGNIFGHEIINGSWNQVEGKINFTELVPTGSVTDPIPYRYEAYLINFCPRLEDKFTVDCTRVLVGSADSEQGQAMGEDQFGWLGVKLQTISLNMNRE